MKLTGKVALITGSAKRVGKALALELAKEGCHIVVHYGRSAEAAENTIAELKALGVNAWAFSANLANEEAVKAMVPIALEKAGQLDILINSASVFPEATFASEASANWDKTMMINLKAPFLLSQAFANQLPAGNQGKIINLLDAAALRPQNHHFAYTISKYGLDGLTKATAQAVAGQNIQVNAIALGAILPNSNDDDPGAFEQLAAKNPSNRTGDPKAVSNALVYLLKKADYVTGETIRVDGGQHLV